MFTWMFQTQNYKVKGITKSGSQCTTIWICHSCFIDNKIQFSVTSTWERGSKQLNIKYFLLWFPNSSFLVIFKATNQNKSSKQFPLGKTTWSAFVKKIKFYFCCVRTKLYWKCVLLAPWYYKCLTSSSFFSNIDSKSLI